MKTEYKKQQEKLNNQILIVLCLVGVVAIYFIAQLLDINIIL